MDLFILNMAIVCYRISIVAASQLVKGREAERELLMRWIDVVDYE